MKMSEALVVNMFLWVRVFLVGGILLLFPRITRKGLLFGVYVGEEFSDGPRARALLRSWDRGCLTLMVSALLVGLLGTLAGRAVAGNLTGTAVLLLGGAGLYLRSYGKVKSLARPDVTRQGLRATAVVQDRRPRGETFALITLVLCLVAALATIGYGLASFQSLPSRLPSLWSLMGGGDGWASSPHLTVMYLPGWNLAIGPVFALVAMMISTAKRSLREDPGGGSAEAQDAFRAVSTYVFSGSALVFCALLTYVSVQVIRIGLGKIDSMGAGVFWLMGLTLAFTAGGLVLIFRRFGQGGALLENPDEGGALTGGLADNSRWVLGVFYIDRDDPSMMVEGRFGIGYTMNYGNWKSVAFVVLYWTILLSLVLVGVLFL
jgi:uncharacterized membrane protein